MKLDTRINNNDNNNDNNDYDDYDENEPSYITMYKIQQQIKTIRKQKYYIILDFLNELFQENHNSLFRFVIKFPIRLKLKHINNIITKYSKKLNIKQIKSSDELIDIIKKIISNLDYDLKNIVRNETTLYLIKSLNK